MIPALLRNGDLWLRVSLFLGIGGWLIAAASPTRAADSPPVPADSLTFARTVLTPAALEQNWVGATLEAQMSSLGAALVGEGYLEARLQLFTSEDGGLRLEVEPGPSATTWQIRSRVRGRRSLALDSLRVAAPGPESDGAFPRMRLEDVLSNWVRDWSELGFPFAVASVDSVKVRGGVLEAGLSLELGQRRLWGELSFPGLTSTRPEYLMRLLRLRPGRIFTQSALERAQLRLERSGLFSVVGDPRLESIEGGRLRIHFPVAEGQHNRVEGAVGYSGESESVNGWISLELGNLFGTGRSLDLRWDRLREDRTLLDLAYREPLLLGWPVAARLQIRQEVRDSTYTLDRTEAALEIELGGDFVGEFGGERRRSVLGSEPNSELVRRTSSLIGLRWDTVRPTRFRGSRVGGTLLTGRSRVRSADGTTRRERVDRIDLDFVHWFVPRHSWRVRTQIQAAGLSGDRDRPLPLSEALWVGGAATLRGFEEQAFATRRFAITRIEAGPLLSGEPGRVYLFVDGSLFRSLTAGDRDRREIGWGIGIANEGKGRSMVIDFGIPGGRSLSSGRLHLRLATRF